MAGEPKPYLAATGPLGAVKVAAPPGGRLIDLSLNESPFGTSPAARAAAQARCDPLNRYPDPASTALRQAIGAVHGLDPSRLICGNGSEELLDVVARVYARPGDEILMTEHGFSQFGVIATRVGATLVIAPERGLTTDVAALLARVSDRTKLVFLANPNNPTGTYIGAEELARLHRELPPTVVLVIDSAYAEYVSAGDYDSGLDIAKAAANVVVTRTFSKAYGLAALRVGWGFAPAGMVQILNGVRGVGNLNAIGQEAAIAALSDPGFVANVQQRTAAERTRLAAGLRDLGGEVPESVTNFLLMRLPDAAATREHLAQEGIIVRRVADHGLPDYLRITIGLPEDNDTLLASLGRLSG